MAVSSKSEVAGRPKFRARRKVLPKKKNLSATIPDVTSGKNKESRKEAEKALSTAQSTAVACPKSALSEQYRGILTL